MEHYLGEGRLNWNRMERVSDRYGTVSLWPNGEAEDGREAKVFAIPAEIIGKYGELRALVTKTRTSGHIGDLFHGLFPSTPEQGSLHVLGRGFFFVEEEPCLDMAVGTMIGLEPKDERKHWWLTPQVLYRVHDQDVVLTFVPIEED